VKIAVVRETREGEARVAMVPELVGKLTGLGYDVTVEPDAGKHALVADEEYVEAGAAVDADAVPTSDVVVSVQPLGPDVVRRLKRGAATVSFLPVNQELSLVADLRDVGATAFAMELVPRISRAQSMDALSSQALVSGYRCAIVAAGMLRRFFPLNMTAAGTVQPAEIVVLGAGVAGLQAIATCKRLGAVVRAYDVRAAAAEEIRSMGAKAIELELETLEGAADGAARAVRRGRGCADHHRRRPRPDRAEARDRRDGRGDEAGLGRGRPRRRDRRQRRGGRARRGDPDRERLGLGGQERAVADARTGLEALRPERRQPPDPDDEPGRGRRRRLRARLRRRDRGRCVRHA
jgi:H+-translocating NAD(P) transhydrogenase subunit alpha